MASMVPQAAAAADAAGGGAVDVAVVAEGDYIPYTPYMCIYIYMYIYIFMYTYIYIYTYIYLCNIDDNLNRYITV